MRSWKAPADILTLAVFVWVIFVPPVTATPRVFTTCDALDRGLDSSVFSGDASAADYCPGTASGAFASGSAFAIGEGSAAATSFSTAGPDEAVIAQTALGTSTALSSSSAGSVPVVVIGGDSYEDASSVKTEAVETLKSDGRPVGTWFTIVAVEVAEEATAVWRGIDRVNSFLSIALEGLGTVYAKGDGRVVEVKFPHGDKIVFAEDDRSDANYYLVLEIAKASPGVFPGFDFEGSRIYVHVQSGGVFGGPTAIEFGWEPPKTYNVGGDLVVGTRLLEALLLEIGTNFERAFGERCGFSRNVRTVEGDCNNLERPLLGVAGSALRRLGGPDPAYPRGDRSIPSGPLNVNVRDISNALFSTSPGSAILEEQAASLRRTCAATYQHGLKYIVCPLNQVTIVYPYGETRTLEHSGIAFNEHEELVFEFASSSCTLDIVLKCSGETFVEIGEEICGGTTHRFFDPVGCVIFPAEDSVLANSDGLTDLFFTFGQFVDHDFGLSPLSEISKKQPGFSKVSHAVRNPAELPIEIPDRDFHFSRPEFEFTRAEFSEEVPNSHVNQHSSFLDGSQIYGVDYRRARLLRSFEGGKLALSSGNLPPFNGIGRPGSLGAVVDNGPNTDGRFFVVGDVRGNEQLLLLSMHIVFLREHNLVAAELAEAFPYFDDEKLYQTARMIVIAEYQCIIYNEWLPLLLGKAAPDARAFDYDPSVDATVSAIFTTAAFRFGHSMVGTNLLKMGPGSRARAPMELIPIRDVFFEPEEISRNGVEPFLRGGAWHLCKEMDSKVVDELRNFLIIDFPIKERDPPRFDLISLNLQRGRDMGIPSFNDVRQLFGLERYKSFSEFIADPNLSDLAERVYGGDVDQVEAFFGGSVEEHAAGGQLGQTFLTIIADQFRRSRDGDRFFYTGIRFDDELVKRIPRVQRILNNSVRLSDVILGTTGIQPGELGERRSVFQVAN